MPLSSGSGGLSDVPISGAAVNPSPIQTDPLPIIEVDGRGGELIPQAGRRMLSADTAEAASTADQAT